MDVESGWKSVRLGELVKVQHGWPFKSEFMSGELSGAPIVVNIGNFDYAGGFRLDSTTLREYRGPYPKEYKLKASDILLVMTCQTAGGEILGIPAKIPQDDRVYLHNQRLGKIVLQDPTVVDENFLYSIFLWQEFRRALFLTASGTKILHTSPSRIESFRFLLPPLEEQRAISLILGALDDKISLNRRMNQTLEAMARAIFESWFVDFELSSGSDDWSVVDIYRISRAIYGAPFSSTLFNEEGDGKPLIRIRDLMAQSPTIYTTEEHPKGKLVLPGENPRGNGWGIQGSDLVRFSWLAKSESLLF